MTTKRTNRSPQKQKSRSTVTLGMITRSGGGIHKGQGEYIRRPKHLDKRFDSY